MKQVGISAIILYEIHKIGHVQDHFLKQS